LFFTTLTKGCGKEGTNDEGRRQIEEDKGSAKQTASPRLSWTAVVVRLLQQFSPW